MSSKIGCVTEGAARALQTAAWAWRCRHNDWPPFDPPRPMSSIKPSLRPFADAIKGKHLIVVPSGPLTSLPFHVLVTEKPDPGAHGYGGLPTSGVAGVAAARHRAAFGRQPPGPPQAWTSKAGEPYLAFGNPLLVGASGTDRRAWNKQRCCSDLQRTRVAGKQGGNGRGGITLSAISLETLRTREPLPETADEICAVADALGVVGNEADTVWLGERATERNLKALSREGKLARYKVVHFATHGLLSGESAAILKARAEPALILTPPRTARQPQSLRRTTVCSRPPRWRNLSLMPTGWCSPRAIRRPERKATLNRCPGWRALSSTPMLAPCSYPIGQ